MVFFTYSCSSYSERPWSSLLFIVPAPAKEHGLLYLLLFQLQQKSKVFFAYSCSSYCNTVKYGLLCLFLFQLQQKHGLLCLFLFQLQHKARSSLLILVPATAKSIVFFTYSCSSYSKKGWSFLLILVPTSTIMQGFPCLFMFPTAKKHVLFCLFLFQGAAKNHSFLSQGRRIPTTYLLPLTWLLGLLLVLPYLKFIDYFSLEVSIIDNMFTLIYISRGQSHGIFCP